MVVPGANALVDAADVEHGHPGRGDMRSASSKSRCRDRDVLPARARRRRAIDPQSGAGGDVRPGLLDLVDIVVLNETELGVSRNTERARHDAPARLIALRGRLPTAQDQNVCVTLGKRGVVALVDGEASMIAGRTVTAIDTTGAGDCFVGALAARLAGGTSSASVQIRQCRGLDLRSADGRRTVDADGGRG